MPAIFVLLISFLLVACSENQTPEESIPEVFVIEVTEQPYQPSRGFNGRIRSSSDVDIKAQITGELTAIHFKEGDKIKAGTLLYEIDPAPYKAELSRAKSDLARAEAAKLNAEKNFERGKTLIEDGFIAAKEFDELETRSLEANAAYLSSQAALEKAEVNLAYTQVRASQDGRVGRSGPAVGDIVGPQTGVLTTLVGEGGMDVVFQLPEKLLISLKRNQGAKVEDVDVKLQLPDGSEYAHRGQIDYVANRVDPSTGTFEVMANLPNPDELLRPGMFVKVILQLNKPLMGLLIPQATVQVDQQGTYVLAVDEKNIVTRKNLVTGERLGENTLVNSGVEAGDRVIIRGVQKARPGQEVAPLAYEPATKASGDE